MKEVSMKPLLRRAGAGFLALAALLTAGGCTLRTQTAFTIDGVVTTNRQVSVMIDGCAAALGSPSEIPATVLVTEMIHADVAQRLAAANNIAYSDEELRQPLESGALGDLAKAMLGDPACAQLALDLTLEVLVVRELGGTVYAQAVGQIPITVNPRFGVWNPADMSVDGSGSLSQKDG